MVITPNLSRGYYEMSHACARDRVWWTRTPLNAHHDAIRQTLKDVSRRFDSTRGICRARNKLISIYQSKSPSAVRGMGSSRRPVYSARGIAI